MARKKPSPPNSGDAEWRDRILDATRRCLSAKGFHDLTIDDISRTSLTPKSVLYRYFANKETILNETVQRSSRQSLAVIFEFTKDANSGPDSVQRLIKLMMPILGSPMLFDLGRFNIEWWAWAIRSELGLRGFRETWSEWRENLARVIRSELGIEQPEEVVRAMAGLMLAIYNGLLLHATLEGDELDLNLAIRLQQLGWEGIIERVRGGALSELPSAKRDGSRKGR